MPDATVVVAGQEDLMIRINGATPNFRLETDKIRARALEEIDPVLLDLLEIASTVFAADGKVKRGGDTRVQMGQDWRRHFQFRIPVRRPSFWSRDEVTAALIDAVSFLTDDVVEFDFHPGDFPDSTTMPYLRFDPDGSAFSAEEVIMFSGGLDSFAGALEALSSSPSANVILVTHRSAQKVIPRQEHLGGYLIKRFPGRVLHIQVLARRIDDTGKDQTQRSRSFLFAALGQVIAQTFGGKRVSFYENGVVSHNLPISSQIVGTMATRTTHPLALRKLDRLMQLVGKAPVPTDNRYQWLTKTEVVQRIKQYEGADQIPMAVSCTSVREQSKAHTHCGACSQCLDRRFAILAAGLQDHDFEEDYATEVLFGARESEKSRTMAVEWTRHALSMGDIDPTTLMERFGLETTRILRGHPELGAEQTVEQILKMHRRHFRSVQKVLEAVVRDRAIDIVDHNIPASSLVGLHLARVPGPAAALPEYRKEPVIETLPDDWPIETDIVLDPDEPLRVGFFLDPEERPVISVEGLCRIIGGDARVPHALKPIFDEDRQMRREAVDYRYAGPTRLEGLEGLSKQAIRASVRRCRNRLNSAFRDVHGVEPDRHLLIQSKSPKGYRLDPTIEIQNRNR